MFTFANVSSQGWGLYGAALYRDGFYTRRCYKTPVTLVICRELAFWFIRWHKIWSCITHASKTVVLILLSMRVSVHTSSKYNLKCTILFLLEFTLKTLAWRRDVFMSIISFKKIDISVYLVSGCWSGGWYKEKLTF